MMLSYFWIAFIVVAFIGAVYSYVVDGNIHVFQKMVTDLFENSTDAVMKIALPLVGIMAFWLGMMKIAEESGLIQKFSRALFPFFSNIFPTIPKNHPAVGHMTMNFSANLLGLDNAATPFGLKAMQSLQDINYDKSIASNAQIMFVLLHASGLTLIPISIMAQRSIYGASNPTDVFIPIAVSTTFTTLVSLGITALWQGIRLRWRFIVQLLFFVLGVTLFVVWIYTSAQSGGSQADALLSSLPDKKVLMTWDQKTWEQHIPNIIQFTEKKIFPLNADALQQTLTAFTNHKKNHLNLLLSNLILLFIPVALLVYGLYKKRNVFEDFVEGAKESFSISLKIIPYLVGLLVAIGLMRSAGVIDTIIRSISYVLNMLGMQIDFVPSLSTALMKPLSGSGARAMMIETMKMYGADSFVGKMSSIFQGTSDTLFYVIALYFGSVGIRQTRYTVLVGLLIDIIGISGAILVGYFFFH